MLGLVVGVEIFDVESMTVERVARGLSIGGSGVVRGLERPSLSPAPAGWVSASGRRGRGCRERGWAQWRASLLSLGGRAPPVRPGGGRIEGSSTAG